MFFSNSFNFSNSSVNTHTHTHSKQVVHGAHREILKSPDSRKDIASNIGFRRIRGNTDPENVRQSGKTFFKALSPAVKDKSDFLPCAHMTQQAEPTSALNRGGCHRLEAQRLQSCQKSARQSAGAKPPQIPPVQWPGVQPTSAIGICPCGRASTHQAEPPSSHLSNTFPNSSPLQAGQGAA